ncbi:hypothetical protein PPL_06139 [Heterostelium album PN500]|uniref:Transmembrane protein n=1 Tax=Heterostelium pallidum (strain ATCC 26659 / Pp 5 / PN500) TaxID=670386 RepID=D3BCB4_HETP5|nr:hypothetical protein PPL_06139 [Heterostelium album PN500]EFA80904.1 hypothetical protein PPL_06139 [Heterostelium album PN500]|eukprot:XP_020433022.1 hypothetical protein PPL_06139 [Heterostelium album PN500]
MNRKLLVSVLFVGMIVVSSATQYFLFQQFTDRDCSIGNDVYASYHVAGQCYDSKLYTCFDNGTAILQVFSAPDCSGFSTSSRSFDLAECNYGFSIKCTEQIVVPNNTLASYAYSEPLCQGSELSVKYQRTNTCFSGSSITCNGTTQTYNYFDSMDCSGSPSIINEVTTQDFCPEAAGIIQTREICQ